MLERRRAKVRAGSLTADHSRIFRAPRSRPLLHVRKAVIWQCCDVEKDNPRTCRRISANCGEQEIMRLERTGWLCWQSAANASRRKGPKNRDFWAAFRKCADQIGESMPQNAVSARLFPEMQSGIIAREIREANGRNREPRDHIRDQNVWRQKRLRSRTGGVSRVSRPPPTDLPNTPVLCACLKRGAGGTGGSPMGEA